MSPAGNKYIATLLKVGDNAEINGSGSHDKRKMQTHDSIKHFSSFNLPITFPVFV